MLHLKFTVQGLGFYVYDLKIVVVWFVLGVLAALLLLSIWVCSFEAVVVFCQQLVCFSWCVVRCFCLGFDSQDLVFSLRRWENAFLGLRSSRLELFGLWFWKPYLHPFLSNPQRSYSIP